MTAAGEPDTPESMAPALPTPPPLPIGPRPKRRGLRQLWILALILLAVAIVLLRPLDLLRPFSIPTGAMTPAVSAGDHVMMEGLSRYFRSPRRGEIVVFRTDGLAVPPPPSYWVKRVAGLPGERLRLVDGKLQINDHVLALSNALGGISYPLPPGVPAAHTNLTIPDDCYFMLGDNSTNSYDSRFFGCVPARNIVGRLALRYWPAHKIGRIQ